MARNFRASALVLAMLSMTLLSACSASLTIETFPAAEETKPVKAVVLLPPDFYYRGMQAFHVYEKWMDLARLIALHTNAVAFGPDEVRILASQVDDLLHDTDIRSTLKPYNIDPSEVVAVKIDLFESWQEGQSLVRHEKVVGVYIGKKVLESDLRISLTVYQIESTRPVVAVKSRFEPDDDDPIPSAGDSRPELTRFARDASAELLRYMGADLKLLTYSADPIQQEEFIENPLESLPYRHDKLPPLADLLAKMDDLDRDVALRARIDYRYPNLDREAVRAIMDGLSGLYVLNPRPCSNLQVGDIVRTANGRVVTREYQIEREVAFSRASRSPMKLAVLRDGQTIQVDYGCTTSE